MYYSEDSVSLARAFMQEDNGTYSRLADHLNIFRSETDGTWTKDRAYHLCRINGIRSNRRCKAQPAAANTQRAHTRQRITTALLEALSASGVYETEEPSPNYQNRQVNVYDNNQAIVEDENDNAADNPYLKHLYEKNKILEEVDEFV